MQGPCSYSLQRGVALITILLVVAIATVLGVSMATEQNFSINRARSFFDQGKVRQYALGGEELARQILHEDFINAPNVDHLQEAWADQAMKFDFEEGEIQLHIEDLQAKFNLNSLVQAGAEGLLAKQRFANLVAELGLDAALTDRLIDWLDSDNSVLPLGAEDYNYLGLDRPYRTGDQAMIDPTELRLILELDQQMYAILASYVTVIADPTSMINVNTASAAVIQIVAPGVSQAVAEGIVSNREAGQPYQQVSDFTADPAFNTNTAGNIVVTGLSVQSSFFKVSIRARYQDRIGYLTSVIQRNSTDGLMRVIYRNQSTKIPPIVEEV